MGKILFIAALMISAANAEDEPNCSDDSSIITQYEMNFCSYQSYLAEDTKLNEIRKLVKPHVQQMDVEAGMGTTEAMDALVSGQRGWINYRDGACKLYGAQAGRGTIRPLLEISCRTNMTQLRTKELKEFVEKKDGF